MLTQLAYFSFVGSTSWNHLPADLLLYLTAVFKQTAQELSV